MKNATVIDRRYKRKSAGNGRLECLPLSIARMMETQLPRMQHLSRKFGRALLSVNFVAKNRMTEMMQMHANLMRASAVKHAFDQTNSAARSHDAIIGAGAATAFFVHRHALPMFGVASDDPPR